MSDDFSALAQSLAGEFGSGAIAPAPSYSFSVPPLAAPGVLNLPASIDAGGGGFSFGNLAAGLKDIVLGRAGSPGATAVTRSGGLLDLAGKILPMGAAGLSIFSGLRAGEQQAEANRIATRGQKLQAESAQQAVSATAPLRQFGEEQLRAAQEGKIPEAIQAKIDQWAQAAKQQAHDYLARTGQGDSESLLAYDRYIDQQAKAMAADYLMEIMGSGTQALGTAGQVLAGAAGSAGQSAASGAQSGSNIANLIALANQNLAQLSGRQG